MTGDSDYLVENAETAFYGSRWFAAVPLFVMLAPVIALTFLGVLSSQILVASGIIGIATGSLFCRRKKEYWDVVTKSLTDPLGLIVFSLFLLVGIYGKLLTSSQLTEGIVWLSQQLLRILNIPWMKWYFISQTSGQDTGLS